MTDIDVQKRAEDALREADRRKDEFLAMLGHELRNPLSPVRNAAEVLGMLHNEDPRLDWARRVIVRQVDYLTHLVDDLLDISRITRGAIKLRRESVDMAAAVRRALEAVADLLSPSNHEMRVTVPNEPLYVEGDSVRLVQICENLLTNAIKYSDVGSEIKIELRLVEDQVVLNVCDQGIGLAPEAIGRVFDLFVQDARAIDRSQGGLGIGLALVRHLVELHHGTVEAFSEGPGRGSEFTVRLPALLRESKDNRMRDPAMAAKDADGVRVLVVDDDPDSAESMAMLLKLSGHTVATAGGLDQALEAARSLHPQLVLMDIGLPGADGYEVGRRLRTLPEAENAVIAALTGFGQADDIERTQRESFAHHFVKPVDPAEVERFIAKRFGSKT
jgi:two-component system, chemotaxis family, CheB/CheR fusion protein